MEGEAVILSFPMFARVLHVRRIAPSSARYVISKANGSEAVAPEDRERVVQSHKQLWFLPVKASDSGEYTCTYRCALKPPRHNAATTSEWAFNFVRLDIYGQK